MCVVVESERELVATAKGALLTYILMVRGKLHISEAAVRLECTERHVYRVVGLASGAGVPVTIVHGWIELLLNGDEF